MSLEKEAKYQNEDEIHHQVSNYYGKVLSKTEDLKTNACCTGKVPAFLKTALQKVPSEIIEKYYGCGSPFPSTNLKGLSIVDLGSGSGRDCYVAAQFVGENGRVVGVDMTDEQVAVAQKYADAYCRETLGYKSTNLAFVKGMIEFLDKFEKEIPKGSVDLVISNCVVNLSPDKQRVLQGVFHILKEGGELYFSDVDCDRRLPTEVRNHEVLFGECIAGALYTNDFVRICRRVGFADPRVVSRSPITVNNPELQKLLGNAKFESITYRVMKISTLEDACEDYGQVASYKGTIQDSPLTYKLDESHVFEVNKPVLICKNTADMLTNAALLKGHFEVTAPRQHFGAFDCSPSCGAPSSSSAPSSCAPQKASSSSCCPSKPKSSGCC